MNCPNANCTIEEASGNYCYKCGTTLVNNIRCECGQWLSAYDNYCPNCGISGRTRNKVKGEI